MHMSSVDGGVAGPNEQTSTRLRLCSCCGWLEVGSERGGLILPLLTSMTRLRLISGYGRLVSPLSVLFVPGFYNSVCNIVKKGKRGACQQKAATVLPNRTAAA